MSEKLNEYLVKLGYTSAHVVGLMSQLLTQGKVRVDFRNFVERIELANAKDRMAELHNAVEILEDYIKEITKGQPTFPAKNTQNITVEPLKEL